MPKTGCPEPTNRGWNIGYIDFVTLSAFTTWRHASDVTHGEYNITEIVVAEEGTNVKGPIKKYFFRLNFCFKQAQLNVINDTKWPRGEYSIFGATEGCPKGIKYKLQRLGTTTCISFKTEHVINRSADVAPLYK